MDGERFDRIAKALGTGVGRRGVLRGALGAALGAALGVAGVRQAAAQGTCLENGSRCGREGDGTCCSGVCKRKRGTNKKFCRQAPGQGNCTVEWRGCPEFLHEVRTCGQGCECYVTTRGASFCGDGGPCVACEQDADCEKTGKKGSKCITCRWCPGGNTCVAPCPNPD